MENDKSQIPDNLFKRLQKLLRLAESATKVGSLAEAENAALKAQEILIEYNLSMSDIDLKDKPPIIKDEVGEGDSKYKNFMPKNEGKWLIELWFMLCRHNFCRGILHGKWGFTVLGEAANTQTVIYMGKQLESRLRCLAKEAYKVYKKENGWENKNAYIRGFLLGAVNGIDYKLYDQRSKMAKDNSKITDLIIVKGKEVREFEEKEFPTAKPHTAGKTSAIDGKNQGFRTGKQLQIHEGIETNALNQHLLN